MLPADVSGKVDALLDRSGLGSLKSAAPLSGGKNNRVYRVDTSAGKSAAVKLYFHHPDDPRDRLGAEYGFASLAWRHGIRALPQPLASDLDSRIGLYEYVMGERLAPGEVDDDAVAQALAFLKALNRSGVTVEAAGLLKDASEACFSVAGHRDLVARRVERLAALVPADDADRDALEFVRKMLLPAWQRVQDAVTRQAKARGVDPAQELTAAQRMISPCDFGFHNALRTQGGYRFIDFEYAGWDDPARVLADFFNQVAVPVPLSAYERAKAEVSGMFRPEDRLPDRFDLLLPVYAIKWAAIVMNDFLPAGRARRDFAAETAQAAGARKRGQLDKAAALLTRLDDVLAAARLH